MRRARKSCTAGKASQSPAPSDTPLFLFDVAPLQQSGSSSRPVSACGNSTGLSVAGIAASRLASCRRRGGFAVDNFRRHKPSPCKRLRCFVSSTNSGGGSFPSASAQSARVPHEHVVTATAEWRDTSTSACCSGSGSVGRTTKQGKMCAMPLRTSDPPAVCSRPVGCGLVTST